MQKFRSGDRVKWSSQANGNVAEKTGIVIEVIAPKQYIYPRDYARKYSIGTLGHGNFRKHESYLIAVKTGATEKAKKSLYWPRVSALSDQMVR